MSGMGGGKPGGSIDAQLQRELKEIKEALKETHSSCIHNHRDMLKQRNKALDQLEAIALAWHIYFTNEGDGVIQKELKEIQFHKFTDLINEVLKSMGIKR